jgi:sulfate adenylyltransferase subunit 2
MHSYLNDLEAKSIYIIREAYNSLNPMCMLWSIGKDSTAMLWLVRKAFFGLVPFPLVLLDTGMEMDEVYAFRDTMIKDWDLNCINHMCPPLEDMDKTLPPNTRAAMRKTEGLKSLLQEHKFQGVLAGIRRDEQGLRAKERVFSPRSFDGEWDFKDQPPEFWDQYKTDFPQDESTLDAGNAHMRIHPILHWTELDIWRYIQRENIPCCDLYFARKDKETKKMMRYRSLGEKNLTFPVESSAADLDDIIIELETTNTSERAGRSMDKETEDSFEKLRAQGYM